MLNRHVLSCLREIVRDSALVTSVGSEFNVPGAATLKARDARASLVRGISRSLLSDDLRLRVGTCSISNALRCYGSPVCRILYESNETLYSTRWRIGSQCNRLGWGWCTLLTDNVTTRTSVFWIRYITLPSQMHRHIQCNTHFEYADFISWIIIHS